MPVPILCPCSAKLRVADHLKGQAIQCPKCQAIHDVPAADKPVRKRAAAQAPELEEVLQASGYSPAERQRLEQELEEGESLLWAGKPDARAALLAGMGPAAGGLFLAIILGIFLIVFRINGHGPQEITLPMGAAAIVALIVGAACPVLNRYRYAQSAYALTNRRALAWARDIYLAPYFMAYGPEDLAALKRSDWSPLTRGVGQLLFAREVREVGQLKVVRYHGFFYVRDAATLERLLHEQLIDPHADRLLA
jgi:hypothetical protein